MSGLKNYWLSWYQTPTPFTLHSPWWISGYRYLDKYDVGESAEQATIVAAVKATSEHAAKTRIIAAHDRPPMHIEWRFVSERPDDWSPYCDRFPKGDWMQWPEGKQPSPTGEAGK